jgi:hypothetical protein
MSCTVPVQSTMQGGGGWKAAKNSESLSILKPDLMLRTAIHFPISLPLQPGQEETLQPDWDETLYDPRLDHTNSDCITNLLNLKVPVCFVTLSLGVRLLSM